MNITFLVGNGFDMSLGIDTSYKAFYRWYCDQPSNYYCIEKFKNEIKYDIEKKGENWSDFELGLGRYTKKFTVDTVEEFSACREDAHKSIVKFLEEQQSKCDLEVLSNEAIAEFANGFINYYEELTPKEKNIFNQIKLENKSRDTVVNILSFNYTKILNEIVSKINNPLHKWAYGSYYNSLTINKSIINVHGTSQYYPILGVSDESQIANQDLLEVPGFKEYMIKPYSVNFLGEFWHTDAENIINKSTVIGIFGMSLGKSDSRWWHKIGQWLKNSGRHLIIYWYTDRPLNSISVLIKYRAEKEVKDIFLQYCEFSKEEIENIRERIHIVINTKKVFNIKFEEANSTTSKEHALKK